MAQVGMRAQGRRVAGGEVGSLTRSACPLHAVPVRRPEGEAAPRPEESPDIRRRRKGPAATSARSDSGETLVHKTRKDRHCCPRASPRLSSSSV